MHRKCVICRDSDESLQVVVYSKGGVETGYLTLDDRVLFDAAKICKFAYFCAENGLPLQNHDVIDICESCARLARIGMN